MKIKILVFLLTVILGFLCYLYFVSPPVLFRYVERPAEEKYRASVIFNPFRNREPEFPAESVLKELQIGNYQKAFAQAGLDQVSADYHYQHEKQGSFLDWRLMDRKDLTNGKDGMPYIKLYYLVHRKYNKEVYEQHIIINVENHGKEWRIIRYEAIY